MEYDGESREREETAVEAALRREIDMGASVGDEGSRNPPTRSPMPVFIALTSSR